MWGRGMEEGQGEAWGRGVGDGRGEGRGEGGTRVPHGYVPSETLHEKKEKSILSKLHVLLLYHHDYTKVLL